MSRFDSRKLRGRIVEKYGTLTAFAPACGIRVASISNKLNGTNSISREDIYAMSTALELTGDEIQAMFFTKISDEV